VVTEPAAAEADPEDCLRASEFVDSDHPAIAEYAHTHSSSGANPREQVVELYYAIRDQFRYSPWGVASERHGFRASAVALRTSAEGHCIDKANLLAACARYLGVPSRLHFANVRNHIGTAELEKKLGSDLLVFHGYCELHLDGAWVAATPAFNRALCEKLGVAPLEFDGRADSIFQEYEAGKRFMEYVHDYGSYSDIPFEMMVGEWRRHYPEIAKNGWPRRSKQTG